MPKPPSRTVYPVSQSDTGLMGYSPSIRLIAFDLDGTLVDRTTYIWQTLHDHFGSDPTRREQAKADFFAGRIPYADWFAHDLVLLRERKATRQAMLDCFADLHPVEGAKEILDTLAQRGYRLAVISGSLDVLLDHFFPSHPFHHVFINRLHFDESGHIQGGDATPYDLEGKARGLEELARREGLDLSQCAFVGDNVNDLDVMRVAGLAIGINIKHPDVAAAADLVLEQGALSRLLEIFP